jgi:hypothetical protein
MLLLHIDPNEPEPIEQDNKLCLIHYLHAANVVKGFNNLERLLAILPQVK